MFIITVLYGFNKYLFNNMVLYVLICLNFTFYLILQFLPSEFLSYIYFYTKLHSHNCYQAEATFISLNVVLIVYTYMTEIVL